MMLNFKKPLALTLLILLFLNFFGLIGLPNAFLLVLLIPFAIWGFRTKYLMFQVPIKWMIIGYICSMISCYYFHNQGLFDSIKALAFYYYILLYFVFCYISPPIANVYKALWNLSVIFNILYIAQFILLQSNVIFLPIDEDSIILGEGARFRMIGSGLASLSVFLGINDYVVNKEKKSLVLALSGITVLLLMSFRTMVVLCLLFAIVELFKLNGFSRKTFWYLFIISTIFLALLYIPVIGDKIEYMWEKQFGMDTKHSFSNKEYIRWVTLDYYYTSHFKNFYEQLFGSGYPFVETSYYKNMVNFLWGSGIYWMDWGLLGLSWYVGIIPVYIMIFYSYKTLRVSVDRSYCFLGIWFVYLVVSSITTAEFFRQGNFVIQALCLYLIEAANKEKKK